MGVLPPQPRGLLGQINGNGENDNGGKVAAPILWFTPTVCGDNLPPFSLSALFGRATPTYVGKTQNTGQADWSSYRATPTYVGKTWVTCQLNR